MLLVRISSMLGCRFSTRLAGSFSILETVQAGGIPTSACFRIPLFSTLETVYSGSRCYPAFCPNFEPTLWGELKVRPTCMDRTKVNVALGACSSAGYEATRGSGRKSFPLWKPSLIFCCSHSRVGRRASSRQSPWLTTQVGPTRSSTSIGFLQMEQWVVFMCACSKLETGVKARIRSFGR